MREFDEIDPSLFGVAALPPVYDGFAVRKLYETAAVVLDLKGEAGPDPLDDVQAMLSEMTKELRERFQRFQAQRIQAQRIETQGGHEPRRTSEPGAGAAQDEAERKLGQADAKAAIEAVSLIVRTLEKIDGLQRTILSARRDADEFSAETADFQAVVAEFDRRVEEKARAYFERWKAEHAANAGQAAGDGAMGRSIDGVNHRSMGGGIGEGGTGGLGP